MANKSLFGSSIGKRQPRTDSCNEAGGQAYALGPKQALAQYAATGCFNGVFYADAQTQLSAVLDLCNAVPPEFVAKTALYARTKTHMKDMPALFCVVLSQRSPGLLAEVFDRVIDGPKMLRNFVQMIRSGVVGRKSLGTLPKRLVLQWLESRTDEQLFTASIGNSPSLADVVKMVHPKPNTPTRAALYGYLIGREHDPAALPEIVKLYEKFKRNTNPGKVPVPDVPFQMLTSLPLTKKDWQNVARNASWQTTRMNLNTFVRHGVFQDKELIGIVANRMRHPGLIERARVLPYQLLTAWRHTAEEIPTAIRGALQDAMELSIANVPKIHGKVYVFPDVSGSMHSPVTGHREGSTTAVRCIDVAALVAAAVLRKNPDAEVIPFESSVVKCKLYPKQSVMRNAELLASLPSGGTNCSAPLAELNRRRATGDLIVYVSDNESWVDSPRHGMFGGGPSATLKEWSTFKVRSPKAKMVCIDIQPYATTHAKESQDIINVGGFSDQVFRLLADVVEGRAARDHWLHMIEAERI